MLLAKVVLEVSTSGNSLGVPVVVNGNEGLRICGADTILYSISLFIIWLITLYDFRVITLL